MTTVRQSCTFFVHLVRSFERPGEGRDHRVCLCFRQWLGRRLPYTLPAAAMGEMETAATLLAGTTAITLAATLPYDKIEPV